MSLSPDTYDVAIIGGGPAGLSAALWLARYLHKVVLIDSGDPRNWETRGINGFLGAHSIRSPELRERGRADAEKFGAELVDDMVKTAKKIDDDCYHVCPDCDGYETRGQNTVVVGSGRKAVSMALALTTWTDKIVICTNGEPAGMDQEQLSKLKKLNIPVLEQSVTCVKSKDGEINCLELANEMSLDCERLYFAIGQFPADDIGVELGCKRDERGQIIVDEHNHTSVKNVYAAGDIIPGTQLAIVAAANGAVAAVAIHHSLVPEERRLD